MVHNMKKRQSDILSRLQEKKQLDLIQLAQEFEVSERTIRGDIQVLNELLERKAVIRIAAKKVSVASETEFAKTVSELMGQSDYYQYKLSMEERKAIEALIMLCSNSYTTTSSLAERLSVSKSTIVSEIKELKKLFEDHGLQLRPKTKFGFEVVGEEYLVRSFLLQLIPNSGNKEYFSSTYTSLVEQEIGRGCSRERVRRILLEQEHAYHVELTDGSFKDVENYLVAVSNRWNAGRMQGKAPAAPGKGLSQMAKEILDRLFEELELPLPLPQKETDALCSLLERCKYIRNEIQSDKDLINLQMQAAAFVYDVCGALKIADQISFAKYTSLLNHIDSSLQRLGSGQPTVKNPLLQELEEAYPHIFSVVEEKIKPLNKLLGETINRDEISYIVMYLIAVMETSRQQKKPISAVLVCSSGMCTALLLQAKLKQNFNIEIEDILSLHKFMGYDLDNVDLVISTVWIEHPEIPSVHISPMLTEKDIELLRNVIKRDVMHKKMQEENQNPVSDLILNYVQEYHQIVGQSDSQDNQEYRRLLMELNQKYTRKSSSEMKGKYLHELLCEDTIQLDVHAQDWQEAIRISGQLLLQHKDIQPRYIDKMIQLVKECGPYIVFIPGVAVAHAGFLDGSLNLSVSLIRLDEPVCFHHETNDPVRLVACFSVENGRSHLLAFFHLVKLIADKNILKCILEAKSKREILDIIKFYELYGKEDD